jgi:hypothetical protein
VNTPHLRKHIVSIFAAAAATCICLHIAVPFARAADSFVIQPEIGATEFGPGDRLTITSLRGSEEHLAAGGRYTVDGSYTLSSADSADLAWFATSRGPSGPTPIRDSEHVQLSRGTGTFHLEKTLLNDGWLHLSFYVDGQPHGGIYFGEKGLETTVLRHKSWSDFTASDSGSGNTGNSGKAADSSNRAIIAFLGDPVPPPATLDPRYSPANLKAAFNSLCIKLNLKVQRLEVDDSEFPFVLYGLVIGRCDYHAFANGFRQMEGYDYGGSVTGIAQGWRTNFAIDIIPEGQLPEDRTRDCSRRLMIRLQMLADSAARDNGNANSK